MFPPAPPRSFQILTWRQYARRVRWWWSVEGQAALSQAAGRIFSESWLLAILVLLTVLVPLPLLQPLYRGGVFTSPPLLVTILSTTAAMLAALVGITIAVTLVALQILQATFPTIALQELFRAPTFRRLLTLYLYTIALALGVSASVGDSISAKVIALSYLVGALTIVCLLALYPSLKRILTSTRVSYARLNELVATIECDGPDRPPARIHSRDLERLEGDSAYVLSEIAIRSIGRGDRVVPRMVIGAITDRVLDIVKNDAKDPYLKRQRLNAFLPLYRAVASSAVSHDDELTISCVYRAAELIHKNAAERRVPWHVLVEFDDWLQTITVACAERGLDSSTQDAAWVVSKVLEAHLQHNVPEEEDIWDLNWEPGAEPGEPDYEKANQWRTVSERYISILVRMIESLLERGHSELATMGLMRLAGLMDTVHRMENLGSAQKEQLIRRCVFEAERLVVDQGKHLNTVLSIYPFSSLRLKQWLDADTRVAKATILVLCRTLLRLAEDRRLNAYALNHLGTLARGAIERIDEAPRYGETVMLACETFQQLGETYQSPATVGDVQIVREVQEQLASLDKWFSSKNKVAQGVQSRLHAAITAVGGITVPDRLQQLEKLAWPGEGTKRNDTRSGNAT